MGMTDCTSFKASSSARAAEMVQSAGGFVGFSTMGSDLGYVPVGNTDEIDTSVDSEFRMLLKKVTKKDTATKLKVDLAHLVVVCRSKKN